MAAVPTRAPSCSPSTASIRPPSRRWRAPPGKHRAHRADGVRRPVPDLDASSSCAKATPEQALRHPNWSMGAKISIDSATLMNKGLELIEAYHLFPVDRRAARRRHPPAVNRALPRRYTDGSVLAQMSCPDMRTPIALALSWPQRMDAPTPRLDLVAVGNLSFEAPDEHAFRP